MRGIRSHRRLPTDNEFPDEKFQPSFSWSRVSPDRAVNRPRTSDLRVGDLQQNAPEFGNRNGFRETETLETISSPTRLLIFADGSEATR